MVAALMFGYQLDGAGTHCSGRPQPGVLALRHVVLDELERFAAVTDLGIYNCRPSSGGGGSLSLHGEGRAWDAGIPAGQKPVGDRLVYDLVVGAPRLGIQRLIWWRYSWDARGRRWKPYSGASDHTDHVHVELCWDAARSLTVDAVRAVLNPTDRPMEGATMFLASAKSNGNLWLMEPIGPAGSRRLIPPGDRRAVLESGIPACLELSDAAFEVLARGRERVQ